jgi:hypothetical protein
LVGVILLCPGRIDTPKNLTFFAQRSVRFRLVDGQRRHLKTIYTCADGELELLKRSKKLLKSIRGPARWAHEVAAYTRCAGIALSLVKRLTGR